MLLAKTIRALQPPTACETLYMTVRDQIRMGFWEVRDELHPGDRDRMYEN